MVRLKFGANRWLAVVLGLSVLSCLLAASLPENIAEAVRSNPRAAPATLPQVPKISFSRDIQPLLADNCYFCHGPDSNKRKAGLRFDTEEGAFRQLVNRRIILRSWAGDLTKASDDRADLFGCYPDDQMPPPVRIGNFPSLKGIC